MGLFDSIFGSKKTSTQDTTQKQVSSGTRTLEAEETQIQESERTGISTTEQDTTQQQVTTQLDPETQAILQNLIQGLAGPLAEEGTILDPSILQAIPENLDFASFLRDRATGTEGVLNAGTDAIVAEAQRTGENAIERRGTQLAMGAGSNLNSIVQAANAQGSADLATQLAALRGQLGIQARQAGSQDLATAFGASNEAARAGADISIAGQTAGTQQLAQLVQALTGATTTTVGETRATGTTTEQEQITQLMEALRSSTEVSDQVTNITGSVSATERGRDSLFSNLISVGSLFVPTG